MDGVGSAGKFPGGPEFRGAARRGARAQKYGERSDPIIRRAPTEPGKFCREAPPAVPSIKVLPGEGSAQKCGRGEN